MTTRGDMELGGQLRDGTSVEWWTPPEIFEALSLDFDLDPAAPVGGLPWVPAAEHYSAEDNGNAREWFGRVWLNPPYGRGVGAWAHHLVEHGDGVGLLFARLDTAWAQHALRHADAACFISGRLRFIDGVAGHRLAHNAPAPSMLVAYGSTCAASVLACGLGLCFEPNFVS